MNHKRFYLSIFSFRLSGIEIMPVEGYFPAVVAPMFIQGFYSDPHLSIALALASEYQLFFPSAKQMDCFIKYYQITTLKSAVIGWLVHFSCYLVDCEVDCEVDSEVDSESKLTLNWTGWWFDKSRWLTSCCMLAYLKSWELSSFTVDLI